MGNTGIKTQYQIEKEAKDMAVYNEYTELMSRAGSMVTAVEDYLMKKYNIHSKSTLWFIRRRVEKRLKADKQ